jgi:hypothetical protein
MDFFSWSPDNDVSRLIDYIYPRSCQPGDIRIQESLIEYCSWDSLIKEHPRLPLLKIPMSQIQGIYNKPKLHGHLTKYDSLLGLMDRMGPQTQLWACMGCGSSNFPSKKNFLQTNRLNWHLLFIKLTKHLIHKYIFKNSCKNCLF